VKPFLIIDALEKFANTFARLLEIAIFVAVDLLILQRLHERLACGVVVRIALPAHADGGPMLLQQIRVVARSVLNAAIGMMDPSRLGLPLRHAMRNAASGRLASSVRPSDHPITRREYASSTTAR